MQSRERETEISVGNWIVTLIILSVPIVNLVTLAFWAFGSSALPSKRTFAQAVFILFAVTLSLYLVGALITGTFNLFAG